MAEQEIGKVIHYYNKAMVAVVRLSEAVKVGDTVKIKKNEDEAETKVESMQVDHQPVTDGKSGDEVAIKVSAPTKEGAVIYKMTE